MLARDGDSAARLLKAGISLDDTIDLLKTNVHADNVPHVKALLEAGVPAKHVKALLEAGAAIKTVTSIKDYGFEREKELTPQQIAAAVTFIKEGISVSKFGNSLSDLSPLQLDFAVQHLTDLRPFISNFGMLNAIELVRAGIQPSQIPEAEKLVNVLAHRLQFEFRPGYTSSVETAIRLLKEGITQKEADDVVFFIQQGLPLGPIAVLIKEGIKTSQLEDVKNLLTLDVPLKDIPAIIASKEAARLVIDSTLLEATLKDATPDQIQVVKDSPNKMIMAHLISGGFIDIKDQDEVKAAQHVGFKLYTKRELIHDNSNPYYSLNGFVSIILRRSPFQHFNEEMDWRKENSPSTTHINFLWNKDPRSLDALHERLQGLGLESQASLIKSHIMTAKNAAQTILDNSPFTIDQSFRVEHLIGIENLADHLDVLADGLPQSAEEAEDLHTQAAALRIWIRVAKTKITPPSSK
ncbi:MAG: hypothetical protein B7Y25_06360 [Alphaproteobacteria bacterium 16-39-46]|nr:MAG: hypothetical protein B7Y25_06360 [Alphaproteobacteria bacterium 16-39-46]OZA42325.1 MAG: hypothetical protein B7X84_06430 [Alphaproteobacteria bacterium 17-39-52]HQS84523.1 hypothetical protein [Alphaproteobacteria bacterium]HQS94316.1 hypothetical protein [Alphaproteobacteria bacterium]